MSSSSDNPLVRFAAFLWALGVFALFGFILLVVKLFAGSGEEPNALEEAAAAKRYEVRSAVEAAQNAAFQYKEVEAGKFVQVPPHDVFAHVGQGYLAAKPVAVEKPEQIVPNSDRQLDDAKAAQSAGPVDIDAVNKLTPAADTPIDPAVMELGKTTYMFCATCHGPDGAGVTIGGTVLAPPLAGSEWVTGPVSNLIRIQLRGIMGPITVKGTEYNLAMPASSHLPDESIAAVLTYIRNSFGNKAAPVLVEQVKMLRPEAVANPTMLSEKDLIKP